MKEMTPRQAVVICQYMEMYRRLGEYPSLRELGVPLGIQSANSRQHFMSLVDKGYMQRGNGTADSPGHEWRRRNYRLSEKGMKWFEKVGYTVGDDGVVKEVFLKEKIIQSIRPN